LVIIPTVQDFCSHLNKMLALRPAGKKVLVLGAGGAARAVILTLARFGAAQISIANRTRQRATELATEVEAKTGQKAVGLSLEPSELKPWVPEADLVIQATSVGLYPKGESPSWFNPDWLSPTALVCDLIYRPRPSEF
jgi:shikimate dehydrogenase